MPIELLYAIVVWYISHLLVYERGPWAVFTKLRQFVGVDYDTHGQAIPRHEGGKLILCITCTSFWVACLVVLLTHQATPWILWYSGISVLINRYMEG